MSQFYGWRAALIIIYSSYRKKGFVTISQIITRWAPPSENDTKGYLKYVCDRTGMSSDTFMPTLHDDPLAWAHLLMAMAEMEIGHAFAPKTFFSLISAIKTYTTESLNPF